MSDLLTDRIREANVVVVTDTDGGEHVAIIIDGGWAITPNSAYLDLWKAIARTHGGASYPVRKIREVGE